MAVAINGTSGLTFNDSTTITSGYSGAKAWVNFSGKNTPTITGSYNVGSITRITTGTFRINFTTAMPDTNYAVVSGIGDYFVIWNGGQALGIVSNGSKTTAYTHIDLSSSTYTNYDYEEINLVMFR